MLNLLHVLVVRIATGHAYAQRICCLPAPAKPRPVRSSLHQSLVQSGPKSTIAQSRIVKTDVHFFGRTGRSWESVSTEGVSAWLSQLQLAFWSHRKPNCHSEMIRLWGTGGAGAAPSLAESMCGRAVVSSVRCTYCSLTYVTFVCSSDWEGRLGPRKL